MQQINSETIDWDAMPNMGEEALNGYSDRDSVLFRGIRDVLVAHNAYKKFGLYLIHKHFDLSATEEMVEYVDFEKQTMLVKPVERYEVNMLELVPTNWIFSKGLQGVVNVEVAQWGFKDDLQETEIDPFNQKYAQCFYEIEKLLDKHNSIDRFGMFLLRNQFDLQPEENQLECTDHDLRTLTLTTQLRINDQENAIPTNWEFTPTEQVAANCCVCASNSQGHLGRHSGY